MAINLGFQIKYILNPWCMLFHPAKVPWKVFSILFKIHSACCEYIGPQLPILKLISPRRKCLKEPDRFGLLTFGPLLCNLNSSLLCDRWSEAAWLSSPKIKLYKHETNSQITSKEINVKIISEVIIFDPLHQGFFPALSHSPFIPLLVISEAFSVTSKQN